MSAAPTALSVSVMVYDGAVPVLLVAGVPGHRAEIAFLVDGSRVRPLWPVRNFPSCPADLAAILRQAAQPDGGGHA